jgi:hypothetical protein
MSNTLILPMAVPLGDSEPESDRSRVRDVGRAPPEGNHPPLRTDARAESGGRWSVVNRLQQRPDGSDTLLEAMPASDKPGGANRRQHLRVPGPFDGWRITVLPIPVLIYDLSPGGCFVNSLNKQKPGIRIVLEIELPGGGADQSHRRDALCEAGFRLRGPLRRHAVRPGGADRGSAAAAQRGMNRPTDGAIGAYAPRVLPPASCRPEIASSPIASPAEPARGETRHDGARV